MHRVCAVLISLCCLGSLSLQTADELIAKNIEARGGMEKMKAIKTLRFNAKFNGEGGFTATVGQENQRPNLVRETFSLQGMTAIQAYDGSTGWQTQPFGGKKTPELMGEDDLRDLLLDADFDGPLVDYKEKGSTVEYLGHDIVDGDDALRLKITLKNGDIIYDYLDPDTFIEIRREVQQFIRGSVRDRVFGFGSYKPVDGVMYPVLNLSRSEEPSRRADRYRAEDRSQRDHRSRGLYLPESLKTEEKKSGIVGVH